MGKLELNKKKKKMPYIIPLLNFLQPKAPTRLQFPTLLKKAGVAKNFLPLF